MKPSLVVKLEFRTNTMKFCLNLICIGIWFLVICTCPIWVPSLLLLALYRFLIDKFTRPNYSPVLGLEVGFVPDEFYSDDPKGAIAFVHVFNRPLDTILVETKLRSLLQNEKHNYKRLTSLTLVRRLGYSYWKQCDNFNLKNHIRFWQDKNTLTRTELNILISNWNKSPFKHGAPFWDVLLIQDCQLQEDGGEGNSNHPNMSILGIRIHHIVGDGYSLRDFIETLFKDSVETCSNLSEISVQLPRSKLSLSESELGVNHILEAPLTFVQFIYDFFIHRDSITTNPKESSDLLFASTTCSLAELKALRMDLQGCRLSARSSSGVFNFTLGSLLMFLFGRALRSFLIEKQYVNPKKLPAHVNLAASLPIEGKEHPRGTFCNHWTHATFKVPVAESSIPNSLEQVQVNYKEVVRAGLPIIHTKMSKYYHLVPNCVGKWISSLNIGTSVGFVNMPGSQRQLTFCDAIVEEIIPIAGLQWKHTCMTVAVYSYQNQLTLSVLANQDFIPNSQDLQELLQKYFQEEIRNLKSWVSDQQMRDVAILP